MHNFRLRIFPVMILLLFIAVNVPTTASVVATHTPEIPSRTAVDPDTDLPLFWVAPVLPTKFIPPRINNVAFDPASPGVALASTGNPGDVLLRTVDGGRTWATLPNWLPTNAFLIYRIVYGGQPGVFYMWGGTRIYKTTDAGNSWFQLPYGSPCNTLVTLTVHPTQPTILYAGTMSGFVWSLDAGQTWEPIDAGCMGGPNAFTIGVGVDQPDIVYAGLFYNNGGGVWRSVDQGRSWDIVSTGLPLDAGGGTTSIIKVIVDPRNADRVFALTESGKVYQTTTGGAQWIPRNEGIDAVDLRSLVFDHQTFTLYGASDNQLYYLEDGANSWEMRESTPIPQVASFPVAPNVVVDPSGTGNFIIHNSNGLYVGLPVRGSAALPIVISAR